MHTDAAPRSGLPAISEHRRLRLGMVFLLYVAQGVPLGLFYIAIPAWLAANGASALAVGGFLSATSLPWTLKFFNGFIMERYPWLPMGRRRAWLIGSQLVIVGGLLTMAAMNPAVSDIARLSALSFCTMSRPPSRTWRPTAWRWTWCPMKSGRAPTASCSAARPWAWPAPARRRDWASA